MEGVNKVGRGYNEYVLYGVREYFDELELGASYYYFYTGMSWDNGSNGVLTEEGAGKGLFFKNHYTDIIEGWYCMRDDSQYFNWDCDGAMILEHYWQPEVDEMPLNRIATSWWECGVEDKNSYTQA